MTEDPQSVEVENSALGKIKIRGSDILTTAIGMLMAGGLSAVLLLVWDVRAQATKTSESVGIALKESNLEIARALRESNKVVAESLEKLANETRRGTEAVKEGNCLLALPQDRRVNAANICKSTSRDYR